MRTFFGIILLILVCAGCGSRIAHLSSVAKTINVYTYDHEVGENTQESANDLWEYFGPDCEFPGGAAKMIEWINENKRIPKGFKGKERVVVKFIVHPDGTVSDADFIKSSKNDEVNLEALRLVYALPKFNVIYYTPQKEPIYFAWPIAFEECDTIP